MKLTAWGNYPTVDVIAKDLGDINRLRDTLKSLEHGIAYGNGRSYGDQALAPTVIMTKRYNCFTGFDVKKGILSCQCGVTLDEILSVIVPKGWFLPVTPGTKYITVGGAIASDVHGKNHHKEGTFCDHVISFDIMLPDGKIVTCSKKSHPELYHATCGGNGLTGIILNATFKLKPIETAYIKQRSIKAANIDELVALIEENEAYTYSVAWIDCVATGKRLGRGVLLLGEHATVSDLKNMKQSSSPLVIKEKPQLTVPIMFPNFALNKLSINLFNALYYWKAKAGSVETIIDYSSFFYPLDVINHWNRIYGKRGFTQYQFVVPKRVGIQGVREIVQRISNNGMGSFLAVLKTSGPSNGNYLSFPMEGYTLALDFPIKKSLFPFLDDLDKLVEEFGGRLYQTKDVRMSASFFQKGYPAIKKFNTVRKSIRANKTFKSIQSERLGLK